MRLITYNASFSGDGMRAGATGTSGIYGLADPRDPNRIRYIGSSGCIEHRLYAHTHSSGGGDGRSTPRARWLRQLKAEGVKPVAWVLEEMGVGAANDAARMGAERHQIAAYHLIDEADLNVRETPIGHRHSKDSSGKAKQAELRMLRERVKNLMQENADLRVQQQHIRNVARVAGVALPDSEATYATSPYGMLLCCNEAADVEYRRVKKRTSEKNTLVDSGRAIYRAPRGAA